MDFWSIRLRLAPWLVGFALFANAQAGPAPNSSATPALQMAITFDDLPAHGPMPAGMTRLAIARSILGTLQRERMPPVYGFVNGVRVARYPFQIHVLQAWVAAGEPLGNHTWSHPELDKRTAVQYEAEIAKNDAPLRRVDPDGDWHWFRYPYLEEGDTVEKHEAVRGWLGAHGYRVAEVSMDFQDYLWNEPYARCLRKHDEAGVRTLHNTYLATAEADFRIFRELAQRLYGRDVPYVLLMHVGAFDAHMLPELLALYRERGVTFTTMEQALADPIYRADPPVPTPGGATFNEIVATERKVEIPAAQEPEALLNGLCR